MSIWSGAATVITFVLGTGPFSYPYAFVHWGFIVSTALMAFTMLIAYTTATYMVETISYWWAKRFDGRSDTLFPLIQGEDLLTKSKRDEHDVSVKESPFYIRQKLEIGHLSQELLPIWVKYVILFFLMVYMYGAMCLKYVAGSKSMVEGLSITIYNDKDMLEEKIGFDPYYIAILLFGTISIYFSFGNIENAKGLQIVTNIIRFTAIFLMLVGSVYTLFHKDGGITTVSHIFEFDFTYMHILFGNTIFVFIWHHSLSGITYPIRPQSKIKPMLFWSFIVGGVTLTCEAFLAVLAFSHHTNDNCSTSPWKIQPLYNENFLYIPFIGQVCNFYPFLNVAAVPVMCITMRNNLLQLFGFDSKKEITKLKKGIWSICISLPAIVVTLFLRDPQLLVTYTGGLTGVIILLLIPTIFVQAARRLNLENTFNRENFNKSNFTSPIIPYLIYIFSVIALSILIYGMVKGGSTH